MADTDERDTRTDAERKDTVVVTEGKRSNAGWIIGLIILLLIILFLFANPFGGGGGTDVDAPDADVNVTPPTTQQQ